MMPAKKVFFRDLGHMPYQQAWDLQESLLKENVEIKRQLSQFNQGSDYVSTNGLDTTHHLLFVEHPPVYTLGKSGKESHVLISEIDRVNLGIEYVKTNRGGDITFHGPQQVVGYPIFDLEKFYTDIGKYLRNIEEVVILTLADYGLKGERSSGETGVWLDPNIKGRERKICAIGVRCSRWITMHGFALNVNTDLSYFDHIVPCGIPNKAVTSIQKELQTQVDFEEVKNKLKSKFEQVFGISLEPALHSIENV